MTARIFFLSIFVLLPFFAAADVSVEPREATPGERREFTLTATASRQSPLIEIRLLLPEDALEVSPSVKQGWTVEIIHSDTGVAEIAWRDGSIPPGYRDSFAFEAAVKEGATQLKWTTIERYKDGIIVSWDSDPSTERPNVAPKTTIIDTPIKTDEWYGKAALLVASLALLLGITSLLRHF